MLIWKKNSRHSQWFVSLYMIFFSFLFSFIYAECVKILTRHVKEDNNNNKKTTTSIIHIKRLCNANAIKKSNGNTMVSEVSHSLYHHRHCDDVFFYWKVKTTKRRKTRMHDEMSEKRQNKKNKKITSMKRETHHPNEIRSKIWEGACDLNYRIYCRF